MSIFAKSIIVKSSKHKKLKSSNLIVLYEKNEFFSGQHMRITADWL